MTPSSKILVFDERHRERQQTATFLDKAEAGFQQALAGARAEAAALRAETDPGRRATAVASLQAKLEALEKDSATIVNAHKRAYDQRRAAMDAKFQKLEGLISYGVSVGMVDPADTFILSCLRDAKKAATDDEKFAFYEEALLALDSYGETQNTDTYG